MKSLKFKQFVLAACGLLSAIFFLTFNSISVQAAPKTMPDGGVFDADYYIASNPDVVAALGVSEDILYTHYLLFGKTEGRLPYDPAALSSAPASTPVSNTAALLLPNGDTFDAVFYAAAYPDVVAVFGNDPTLLYQHYVLCGIAEGRLPHAVVPIEAVSHSGVSESLAYQILISLKASFPEGMRWDSSIPSYRYNGFSGNYYGYECAGYAYMVSDMIFGNNQDARKVYDRSQAVFHVGDILRYRPGGYGHHSVVIMEVKDNGIVVTEGNYNSSVHWGRFISWSEVNSNFEYLITRY